MAAVIGPPREDATLQQRSMADAWLTDLLAQAGGDFETNLSTSQTPTMTVGTGFDVLSEACDFIFKHLEEELILVTCFWARSNSLSRISHLLLALSQKALARKQDFRIRICLSSFSLMQKLFHTCSPKGKIYDASAWTPKFGIPSKHILTGLDLQIKSVFIPPLSVMHSKFIVVDRKVCLLPSCNVSWENWFEGCIDLRGPIVTKFVEYWESFWGCNDPSFSLSYASYRDTGNDHGGRAHETPDDEIPPYYNSSRLLTPRADSSLPLSFALSSETIRTMLLPSRHHQNPRFRPFPCQRPPACPQTPLNIFTQQALEGSRKSIYIQSPNVTAPPVLEALERAFRRGVTVQIVTNERLMRIEQLVTAGTTTPRCMKKLIKAYENLQKEAESRRVVDGAEDPIRLGRLQIDYFAPAVQTRSDNSWPVSSHLKLTIIDGEVAVLGSGNMDRASWYTSQELGVALISQEASERIYAGVDAALKGKIQCIYKGLG